MTAPRQRPRSWLAFNGALCAAAAVALAAYAEHGAEGEAQSRLQLAAVFAFGHGLALAALAPTRGLGRFALSLLYLGVLLFSGSLVFNVLAQWPTTFAPLGGTLLIAGWLLYAADSLRLDP